MEMTKSIPIRNIYYMLSYAYDVLRHGDNKKLSSEEFENIYDLFGKILVNGLNLLIKRGFNREYVCASDEISVLRGKIAVNDTIKSMSMIRGKLYCEYDELSSNVLSNKIIKTSINALTKYKKLDRDIKSQLIQISRYFHDIESISLRKSHFSSIQYHRNNLFYKMIIDICELLYDELIVTEQKGETVFKDFVQDHRMALLYEKFILNFYKNEFSYLKVHSPEFTWDKDSEFRHVGEEYLPVMRTDIVLESQEKQLIIDAKYYTAALNVRNVGETKKLISSNLNQIYTYINNSKFSGEIAGMLIYPVVEDELDLVYSIQGKRIYVKTLNLNTKWEEISDKLKKMVEFILI